MTSDNVKPPDARERDEARGVVDLLIKLTTWRRFIVMNTLIVTVAAVVISLLLPNWYEAVSSVLPSKKSGGMLGDMGNFSGALKDITKSLGKIGGSSDDAYSYLAILKSRTTAVRVIQQFNLRDVYGISPSAPIEKVIAELSGNVRFSIQEEGNVTIAVLDKEPQRAADMSNFYVAILNEISTDLSTREAGNNRKFIEARYRQVQHDLASAEDTVRRYQEKYGIYALPEQIKGAIEAAAQIKAEVLAKEIQIGILERTVGPDALEIQSLRIAASELSKKFEELKNGSVTGEKGGQSRIFVPFKNLPELGMEYIRLYREMQIQSRMLEFVVPFYEQFKIEEQKNIPVVLVLDKAMPPEKKAGPMRSLIVLVSMFLSFILSAGIALTWESYSALKADPDRFNKIDQGIISPLATSVRAIFRRGR